MNCPNCTTQTEHVAMDGVYGADIELDLCFACHALWLDKRESLHLSPRGTLDLFRMLHEHRDDPRHALEGSMSCPRCGTGLSLSHDIGKSGRFSYYSCPAGDGRFTPFSEFLKEKQFVRTLNAAEKAKLRADVRTVQCSGCGAPVDVAKRFDCGHCGSPITVLDADAVEKTLSKLSKADAARSGDPEEVEAKARAMAAFETTSIPRESPWGNLQHSRSVGSSPVVDILTASIGLMFGS